MSGTPLDPAMFSNPTVERACATRHPLTVLLADDDDEVQCAVRAWLEDAGHHVWSAKSGCEGVRVIETHAVDLVVTEVILPNGDGLELITALKRAQPDARIVAVSGGGRYLTGPDCLRVAKGLGAHEVLLKPLSRDALLGTIETAMTHAVAANREFGTTTARRTP